MKLSVEQINRFIAVAKLLVKAKKFKQTSFTRFECPVTTRHSSLVLVVDIDKNATFSIYGSDTYLGGFNTIDSRLDDYPEVVRELTSLALDIIISLQQDDVDMLERFNDLAEKYLS